MNAWTGEKRNILQAGRQAGRIGPWTLQEYINLKKDVSAASSVLQYETLIVLDNPKVKSNQDLLMTENLSDNKCKYYLDVMIFNSSTANLMQPGQPSWHSDVPQTVVSLPAEGKQHVSSPDGPDRHCGPGSPHHMQWITKTLSPTVKKQGVKPTK
jgi:hypothetical protein